MAVPPYAAIFTIAKTWKQLKCLLTDERYRNCRVCMCVYVCTCVHIHTKWNVIKQQKEGNPAICDNMNGF